MDNQISKSALLLTLNTSENVSSVKSIKLDHLLSLAGSWEPGPQLPAGMLPDIFYWANEMKVKCSEDCTSWWLPGPAQCLPGAFPVPSGLSSIRS